MPPQSGSASGRRCHGLAGVVPCYNAGPRVRPVIAQAQPYFERLVLVDDGSTDGGVQALADLPIRVITFPHNRGKGHALLAGLRAALEDPAMEAVCCLDADGQHDPAEIPKLHAAFLEHGADLVIGARTFNEDLVPWRSRFGNRVTAALTALLLGARLPDTQSGFRLFSRQFAEAVLESVSGGRYETEMEIVVKALREGCRIESVPIRTIYEEGNRSSHFRRIADSFRIYLRLSRLILRPGKHRGRVV